VTSEVLTPVDISFLESERILKKIETHCLIAGTEDDESIP
jgi:hypothetical protein